MPCFWCSKHQTSSKMDVTRASAISAASKRRLSRSNSLYTIIGEEPTQNRARNALNIKMQLQVLEELTENTYCLSVERNDNKKLGRYEAQDFFDFKEIIGSGCSGVVFRAIFKPTNQALAVKFIPNFRQSKTMVMRELAILKISDQCKYLINFHSNFRVGSNLYFVMELYEGGSLKELLPPRTCMPPRVARVYLKELACALFFLHNLKVVHRDVFLGNCVLTSAAHLRLGDFGLCRTIDDPMGELLTDCGKPAVKAPEVYLDKHCSFGIDWWSFGVMLYRFITGHFPFMTDKLTQGYQSVTKLKVKYPEWLFEEPDSTDLCQKLLVKDPKQRMCYTDEVKEIKSHPYFFGMNWDSEVEENMEHLVQLDMRLDLDQYQVPTQNIRKILKSSSRLSAVEFADIGLVMGISGDSLEKGDKPRGPMKVPASSPTLQPTETKPWSWCTGVIRSSVLRSHSMSAMAAFADSGKITQETCV